MLGSFQAMQRSCAGRVVVGCLVEKVRRFAQHQEAMRETGRHPQLAVIVLAQLDPGPAARSAANCGAHPPRRRTLARAPRAPACPAAEAVDSAGRAAHRAPSASGCPERSRLQGQSVRGKSARSSSRGKKPRASPNTFGSSSSTSGSAVGVAFIRTPAPRADAAGTGHSRSWPAAARACATACRRSSPRTPRDLLGAGDLQALPLLDGLDEHAGFEQALVGAGIEPGMAAAHDLHIERTAARDRGD
jgi:hypothetical protein